MFKDMELKEPVAGDRALGVTAGGIPPQHVRALRRRSWWFPEPIDNHVPVEMAPKGVQIFSGRKTQAEDGGLINRPAGQPLAGGDPRRARGCAPSNSAV